MDEISLCFFFVMSWYFCHVLVLCWLIFFCIMNLFFLQVKNNSFIKLKFVYYTIYKFKVYDSVYISTLGELYNHNTIKFRLFCYSKQNTLLTSYNDLAPSPCPYPNNHWAAIDVNRFSYLFQIDHAHSNDKDLEKVKEISS